MKKIIALLLALTMLLSVAAFAEEQPAFGGSLNVGTFADPDTLNPIVGNDQAGAWIHRNHHFDTIQRLHPLMHPLNTGDAPPPSGHWIRLLFILWRIAE